MKDRQYLVVKGVAATRVRQAIQVNIDGHEPPSNRHNWPLENSGFTKGLAVLSRAMSAASVNSRTEFANSAGHAFGKRSVTFDTFQFDPVRQELTGQSGEKISLTPKALLLLQYMLANAGRVLSKDELMGVLWSGVVVTDDSLVQCVKDLRTALGGKGQQLIATLPRRGYMFDVEVSHAEDLAAPMPASPRTPEGRSRDAKWQRIPPMLLLLLLAALVLGATLGAAVIWTRDSSGLLNIDDEIRKRRSIAVLAFIDDEADAGSSLGQDLADAVASQLIRAGIRVIGRAATVRQDPAEPQFERIGREQGVRFVLAGRIARIDRRIAVDTYLTEIATGAVYRLHEAEFNSGSEARRPRFGRQVLVALQSRYVDIESERAREPGRGNHPVDQLALAWRDLDLANSKADLERARRHLQAATRADPYSVEAMLALGVSHLSEFYSFFSASPQSTLDDAEAILKRALELAPDNARVLTAWAEVLMLRGRDEEATWVWTRSLEIEPESPITNLRIAASMVRQGRTDAAQQHLEKVNDLRPFQNRRQQGLNQVLADLAFAQGRDEDAYRILKQWAAEFPSSARPHLMMAAIDALHSRDRSAAEHMAKFKLAHPLGSVSYVAQTYPSSSPSYLAQRERLLEGLRLAGLSHGDK